MALINQQLGLLEDDIVYRLALLCVNVLQPLKNRYPNVVVINGFRVTNTGIGQHELGEAVDIQIRNQSPELLYEVADYIRLALPFDQLILNFTNIGDGQPWIHVSFTPTILRGQVLTKDYADAFHEGLFLVTPLSGEAAAQAQRDAEASAKSIETEFTALQTRGERLTPANNIGDEAPEDDSLEGGPTEPGVPGPDVPDRVFDIVQAMYDANQTLANGSEDDRRSLTLQICEQIAYEFGTEWGTKSAGGGRPQSKDAIALQRGGHLFAGDWQNGGTRRPQGFTLYEIPKPQIFIPVSPNNHLGV